ncbi:AzlC family ABC transporter permease [Pseudonocardia alaniniphila]|uniref:AzlC family ABC transporter permease n=1 Tax=Pseudonocardia alaniniphila TaxID=75291 RepID=A0ABS9TV74_9PSEU|nr:AzlC family ABC transporter permease [Pseudonocardia alaniniphila]MCH6172288.1 AzlC family ABC transporter permease [Pseudonocardia alaniniphila]
MPEAVDAVRRGRMVVDVDDSDRQDEGYVVTVAERAAVSADTDGSVPPPSRSADTRRPPRADRGLRAGLRHLAGGMSSRDAAGRAPARPSPARRGVTDSVAVIVAYIPFGLTLGASMAATGVSPLVAWSSSPLLFGGAGQLLAVQMLGAGANAAVVVLAALVVNARFLLYSASLAEHAAAWPRRWRWAGAYLLADPVYALATARFAGPGGGGPPRERMAYFFAVGAGLWAAWQVLTGLGVLLAGVLPVGLRLDLAAPLTFLLLLLPMLTSRPAWGAAAAGGVVAVTAADLPLGLGLLVGAGAGIATGAFLGRRHA